ncbi:MAG: hypothetical protein COA66_11960 [Arcobacter sp.]|nr:MAG: hypothetical protein COA66_11960 [Arcobacter sp.]
MVKACFLLCTYFLLTLNSQAKSIFLDEPIFNSKVYVSFFGDKNKQPLILVHGLGNEASTIWKTTVHALKEDFYIMHFDLPGFGNSTKEKKQYTPKKYALLIKYLSDKYIKKPFLLMGHSMGASISLKYTSMYEQDVTKLILIDAAGILHKEAYAKFLISQKLTFSKGVTNQTNDSKLGTFFSNVFSKVEKILPVSFDEVMGSASNSLSTTSSVASISLLAEDFTSILDSIKQKTLIIWGQKDDVAPLRTGYILDKHIKNSRLDIIEDSKHIPMVSHFNAYIRILKSFLNNEKYQKKSEKIFKEKVSLLTVENQKNIVIQGNYKKLIIRKSKNILIKNAKIDELIIYDSDVHIMNTKIISKELAIKIEYSNVLITNSLIEANKPIIARSTRLDIAGTQLIGKEYVIYNMIENENVHVIFSLSKISTSLYKNKNIHKKIVLIRKNKI